MKKISIFMLSLFLIVVISACSSSASDNKVNEEEKVVKVGSIHPLSGNLVEDGSRMNNAIKMAIEEINDSGGIESLDGAKIELIEGDTEDSPEKGVSEVQKVIRKGAVAVLGAYASPVTLAATQESEREGIPFVVDVASTPEITERGFKNVFQLQPDLEIMASDSLEHLQRLEKENDVEIKTAVINHENETMGKTVADYIQKHADEAGLEILDTITHSSDTQDVTSEISKIKSLDPDIIIATNYLNDGTLLFKGLDKADFHPKAILGVANAAISHPNFIKEQEDINQYYLDTNYAINYESDRAKEVMEKYKGKYNQEMPTNAAYAYTSAYLLVDAIERAGSTDSEKIREALTETKFDDHMLAMGPIEFNDEGRNKNATAVLTQIFDGESKIIVPEEFKMEDAVFPMP